MSGKTLTEQQKAFSQHANEAFVKACPGAGKTETILKRVEHLADKLDSRKGIAVVSFTNSAVDEFKERSGKNGIVQHLTYPGFIGTLDSFVRQFIFTPTGVPIDKSPHVVDSWDSLDIEIRLRGAAAYRGNGVVSLDLFDNPEGTLDEEGLRFPPLKRHVLAHKSDYEAAARRYRNALNQKGYYSINQSRQIALQKLDEEEFGTSLGNSLKERFVEVIVDEAQDCNPEDIRILTWLRDKGIRVTMVCDINQSIYEFRDGDKQTILDFADSYTPENNLVIDGSFRCSPAVCSLASSLRSESETDESLGDALENNIPVVLIPYNTSIDHQIGTRFKAYASEKELDSNSLILLSHAGRNAMLAAGATLPQDNGASKVGQVAYQVNQFWMSDSTNTSKKKAIEKMEAILLDLMGKRVDNASVKKSVEEHGLNDRDLRRQALEVLMKLPPSCDNNEDAKTDWIAGLRQTIESFNLTLPQGVTIANFFRTPPRNSNWNVCLNQEEDNNEMLSHSTIHKAKGREFDCVCVVLPPDTRNKQHTSSLVSDWSENTETEAKRVIYVGVTRSKRLTAIAIPQTNFDSIKNILDRDEVSYEVI